VKIFVSIASFQDPILPYTIESIIENANYKKDLVLGIFDQTLDHLDVFKEWGKYGPEIRYKTCDPEDSKGACWARSTIQKDLFEGEDIFMQIDSHTLFSKDWDKDLLEKYETCFNWFEKPLITGYPRGFDVLMPKGGWLNTDKKYMFRITTDDPDQTHVMQIHLPYSQGYHSGQMAHVIPGKKYFKGFSLAGGCIFTDGNFVKDVPYDPNIYFMGEETSLALRAFTHGYDIVHVPNTPLYHWYNTDKEELVRDLHWGPDEERTKEKQLLIKTAAKRVDNVLQGKVTDEYGLGNKRTLKEYAELSGLDYELKTVNLDKATWKDESRLELHLEDRFE
tara:strand:- start:208 stop:1212 length:1005 start_codon:yes stop_codon:yes gene_type:complete